VKQVLTQGVPTGAPTTGGAAREDEAVRDLPAMRRASSPLLTVSRVSFPVVTLSSALAFVGLVLMLPASAWASACDAKAPSIEASAKAAASGEKFSLIQSHCLQGGEAPKVMRAAQLDLYDNGAQVAVSIPAAGEAAASAALPPAAAADAGRAAPAAPNAPPASAQEARVRAIVPALNQAAQQHNIDPLLLHAVAHIESRHNTKAISPAGARGVMQVMPATARRFGVTDPERNLLDVNVNAKVSAAYLLKLRDLFGDDLRLMLAAYNAGEGAVMKYGRNIPPYPETQAYVRDVIAVYRQLSSLFLVDEQGRIHKRARSGGAVAANETTGARP
jgi:soluble lytic murein transglycosylase-like protein